jgi:hypothetical protein
MCSREEVVGPKERPLAACHQIKLLGIVRPSLSGAKSGKQRSILEPRRWVNLNQQTLLRHIVGL